MPSGANLGLGAVGEVRGVGDLATDEVGQAADRVVRPAVGQQQIDPCAGLPFACTEGRADACIAAADDDQPRHEVCVLTSSREDMSGLR